MKKLGQFSHDEQRNFGRGLEQASLSDGVLNCCSKTCKTFSA